MNFERALDVGRVGEGLIAKYMMSRGHSVLPVYEIEKMTGKGPQLFCDDGEYVAPDMLVFTGNGALFIEAKHKSVFSWHRITSRWVTGIDLRHYEHYQRVADRTGMPVWLMFYHRENKPDERDVKHGCPAECPSGLFCGELSYLTRNENHRSPPYNVWRESGFVGHGNSGMVYWADSVLRRVAERRDIDALAK